MPELKNSVRLYVPQQMLGDVMDWLRAVNVAGDTQWDGTGGWFDGHDWIVEPVKIIEIWHDGSFNPAGLIPIGGSHGQSCVMWVANNVAIVENC
jgi:hypothetical protein